MGLFDLTGRVAVVTGGNGGIGLGYARGLAEAGASVAIWGRSEDKNQSAARELRSLGAEVLAVSCDVSDEAEVRGAFAATLERFQRVDACFANAGTGGRGTRFIEMTLEEWREIFRINSEGVFLTLREAARHMLDRGDGGSLVVTSSVSSVFGMPRGEHYAATKAGAAAIVRSLAVEFGRHGIRANAIVPGWIDTDMTAGYLHGDAFRNRVLPRVPLGRWGMPEDFAGLAVYLASDASRWHTGDVITLDGGYCVF